MSTSKWLKNNFEVVEKNGDWELLVNRPVYREIKAYGNCYIIDLDTGKDCGQYVALYCTLFDEHGNKLEDPIYEVNHYEVVERLDG